MKTFFYKLKKRINEKSYLSQILSNMGWLLFDRMLRLSIGLFVSAWITRYLGPEQFGLLNYALALTTFFLSITVFGLNSITVKNLVNHPQKNNTILGSCFLIQSIAASLSFLILLLFIIFLFKEHTSKLVTLIVGLSILLKPSDAIRYYFEANTLSKYTVWAENCSFIVCSVLKIIMIVTHASFMSIVFIFLFETLLSSLLLVIIYTYKKQSIFSWRLDLSQIKHDIKNAWPLLFASLTIIIYMRTDQIMLGQFLDYSAVGIYTAATRISEIFYLIPVIVIASVNPSLMRAREINQNNYYQKITLIMVGLTSASILIAIAVTLTAPYIIHILYGPQYTGASHVLIIHVWTGVFVSLGVISGQWLVIENLQTLFMYRSILGAVINVIANFLLIPLFGVLGAAISTLIAQISATFLFDLFNKKTRRIFWIKLQSMNILFILKTFAQYRKLL